MTDENDDQRLWRLAAGGDAGAFAALFDAHAGSVYRFALGHLADPHAAEDLVSMVFLETWRLRRKVAFQSSLMPWLISVAANLIRNYRRSTRRYQHALYTIAATKPEPDLAEASAARVDAQRELNTIMGLLRKLPAREREAVSLCAIGGLTYAQAAQVMDLSEQAVKQLLARARTQLRTVAGGGDDPSGKRVTTRLQLTEGPA